MGGGLNPNLNRLPMCFGGCLNRGQDQDDSGWMGWVSGS